MLDKKRAYEIIDKVLSYCNHHTMVTITCQEEGLTRFANSEIHQNVFKADNVVEIKVFEGKKESKVTTNILDEESLIQAVKDAEENLRFMPEGELQMPEVNTPSEIAYEEFDEELDERFDTNNRALLIKEGVNSLSEDFSAAGALSLTKFMIAIGNNRGIKRYNRLDTINFNVVVTHDSGVSGYAELNTNKASELDVVGKFNIAYEKAKKGINPISIEPGSYTVILEPLAVGDLLSFIAYCGFSARGAQIGMSCMTGKKGQKVFGDNITITDDVGNENTYPMCFDFEGYEKKRLEIIKNGVLNELTYDIKSAIKDGVETTGHSVGHSSMGGFPINLVMDGGEESFEEMIKNTDKAILVTRFHYMNVVDPRQAMLTALTRDGLYLIENGEIKCGIKNMRFTESMLTAFNNVTSISSDRTKVPSFFGNSYVPSIKIENFHFTGKTE